MMTTKCEQIMNINSISCNFWFPYINVTSLFLTLNSKSQSNYRTTVCISPISHLSPVHPALHPLSQLPVT